MRATYDELNARNDARMQQFHERHKALELFKVESGVGVIIRKSPFNGKSYETHLNELFAIDEGTMTLTEKKLGIEKFADYLALTVAFWLMFCIGGTNDYLSLACGLTIAFCSLINISRHD